MLRTKANSAHLSPVHQNTSATPQPRKQPTVPAASTKAPLRLWQAAVLAAALLLLVGLTFLPDRVPAAVGRDSCLANEILFIAADDPLPENDEPLRLYLLALEQRVTVRSAAAVSSDDAKAKALIIISETVESSTVNTKFREVAVPIVTWEGWLQDDLGMTAAGTPTMAFGVRDTQDKDEGSYGETIGQTQIRIIDAAHPLAGGYSGAVATVRQHSNKFHWGVPNANAQRVAEAINNPDYTMLYAYERGASMVGLAAPARRVFLHNATGPDLTTAGLGLFLNAVYWAMGCLDEPLPPTTTPTVTIEATPTGTDTPTATLTNTATPTPTVTATATQIIAPTTPATPTFTPTATATATPTETATNAVTPTATTAPLPALLTMEKRDLLFNDADGDGQVSEGDTLLYTIRMQNGGAVPLHELVVEDQLDINTSLITGSVQQSLGVVEQGNSSGDESLLVRIATLAPQTTTEIAFLALIKPTSNVAVLVNQATVRFTQGAGAPAGQQQRTSDDPDTPTPNDATLTPLGSTPGQSIYLPMIAR